MSVVIGFDSPKFMNVLRDYCLSNGQPPIACQYLVYHLTPRIFKSTSDPFGLSQPMEMLGGNVPFNQHIDHEAKDGILYSWGMREPSRTIEKEEVETKKARIPPSLLRYDRMMQDCLGLAHGMYTVMKPDPMIWGYPSEVAGYISGYPQNISAP